MRKAECWFAVLEDCRIRSSQMNPSAKIPPKIDKIIVIIEEMIVSTASILSLAGGCY